jgi:outer membrane protein OmpA-like peptidoglycan-associated protein/predicted  nucleic acid-binding Zn-ribbon protein
MPLPATETQLPGPTLIQQSTEQPAPRPPSGESAPDSFMELQEALTAARGRLEELSRAAEAVAASGQLQQELAALQEENQKLRAEIEAARTERGELATGKQAAEARTAELTKTVEQATAKAREMDQELVAVRWQNAQLNTSLAQARTSGEQMEAEARATQNALKNRIEQLEGAAEQTSGETARLRKQIEASEQRIGVAERARTEAEARLSEIRDTLRRAEQEQARIGADLAKVQGELASAKQQAGREQAEIGERVTALENERDELRTRLADVTAELRRSETTKTELESEVAELREAAGAATDAARQNLIAVENQIRELNEALGALGPASGPLETDPALLAESGAPPEHNQADGGGRAAAAPVANVAAVAPTQDPQPGSADADLQRIKTASTTHRDDGEADPMVADLPLEKRLQVQGLLVDLQSKLDERGLVTTVPGELLFALGSDEVQAGAYDTLAKVAELIGTYDDRQVLIVGHSDAMGDAAYNRQLSERRAELVKQFFIDNFELRADRLSTEGVGEARPIASNTTPQGRRANRRVEVLILN